MRNELVNYLREEKNLISEGFPPLTKEQAINLAYDLKRKGASYEMIAKYLKNEGYQSKTGKELSPRTIKNMIYELKI